MWEWRFHLQVSSLPSRVVSSQKALMTSPSPPFWRRSHWPVFNFVGSSQILEPCSDCPKVNLSIRSYLLTLPANLNCMPVHVFLQSTSWEQIPTMCSTSKQNVVTLQALKSLGPPVTSLSFPNILASQIIPWGIIWKETGGFMTRHPHLIFTGNLVV